MESISTNHGFGTRTLQTVGTLSLEMGDRPNKQWGSAPQDATALDAAAKPPELKGAWNQGILMINRNSHARKLR